MLVPLRDTVSGPGSKRVQADVVALEPGSKTVLLSSGERLTYDYAIVAVGAQQGSPAEPPIGAYSLEAIREHYASVNAAILASKKIVIVGGGAAGIEIAGSLRDTLPPEQSVTVVHSGQNPADASLPGASEKALAVFQERLKKLCAEAGLELILGSRVTNLGPADCPAGWHRKPNGETFSLALSTGKSVEADLVLWCVGTRSNAPQLMPEGSYEDKSKLIKVRRTLEVEGMEGAVFAIGDCTNLPEPKMLVLSRSSVGGPPGGPPGHPDIVLTNLLSLAEGKPAAREWPPPKSLIAIVPITRKVGGAGLGVPNFLAKFKQGSLEYFASTHWSSANAGCARAPARRAR
jgi:NADH dehydrogenase FAD-containing subunit